jgi:glycosyltransferase involved in cell wall biosynthesis
MDGGGSERQLLYLMKGLDRSVFEIRLYLLYRRGSLLAQLPDDIQIDSFWDQYKSSGWNWPGKIHRAQVTHLTGILNREKTDVVYERLFHMAMIAGPAVAKISRARNGDHKVRRVSAIVSPPSQDLTRSEKRWLFWKRRLLSRSYRQASRLLAVSEGTARDAIHFYSLPQRKIEVVPSPVDIQRIDEQSVAPIDNANSSRLWQYRGNPRILSIGRLSEEKGHRFLIEAVALYNQQIRGQSRAVDLHLLGDGVCRNDLEKQAHRLGIDSHVFFHGHVDNPLPFLKQCDLFVLPSLYEGLPNVLLEAMACRSPILATNTESGAGEILREYPIGSLAEPASGAALASQIQDRFANEVFWQKHVDLAREFVLKRHDLEQWIGRMSDIFISTRTDKGAQAAVST